MNFFQEGTFNSNNDVFSQFKHFTDRINSFCAENAKPFENKATMKKSKSKKKLKEGNNQSKLKNRSIRVSEIQRNDPYNILGIEDIGSSAIDIKNAYHKKALETHPDKGGSEISFMKVQKAYNILIHEETKNLYDKKGYKSLQEMDSILNKINNKNAN